MTQPPPISPVGDADAGPRPLWSVMIPTYNCAEYLPQTLHSVLAEDPGSGHMQIEVVDDASADRPEDVVRSIVPGRVAFFRQPVNRGVVGNFNTCIERARGHLVHILHGDDVVREGFYARIAELSRRWPDSALLATRSFHVDETGMVLDATARLPHLERPGNDPGSLLYRNQLACAGVVVRRAFYERHGGFHPALVHTADWEMWLRAIQLGGGVVWPEPLAGFRIFGGSDSSRLRLTGENVRDSVRLGEIVAARTPRFDHRRFRAELASVALHQSNSFHALGDEPAARANREIWRELTSYRAIFRRAARALRSTIRDLRRKVGSR